MKNHLSIRTFIRFLPLGQWILLAAMLLVAWIQPYTLQSVPFDWGRMTLEYGRNPAIVWLTLGQVPFLLLWIVAAKPKRTWQWSMVCAAFGISATVFLLLQDPPPFLG
ncbi:MAG: hypothetical protein IPP17_04115 [Bacteroidetes bacterium]|nr:hypothetical protein [Bacteroidota bacterium]